MTLSKYCRLTQSPHVSTKEFNSTSLPPQQWSHALVLSLYDAEYEKEIDCPHTRVKNASLVHEMQDMITPPLVSIQLITIANRKLTFVSAGLLCGQFLLPWRDAKVAKDLDLLMMLEDMSV